MTFRLEHITYSAKGVNRSRNQDSVLVLEKPEYGLFMVFDGVSSNESSYIFIREYQKAVRSASNTHPTFKESLSEILFDVNKKLINSYVEGMSTISSILFDNTKNEVSFINIGDSRIYTFTNQFLEKITEDDSLHDSNNVLTKCLGTALSKSDFYSKTIDNLGNYLICTDGFYRIMESNLKEYFEILNFKRISNIKRKIGKIQKGENKDDSTIILIRNEISN